MSKVTSKLQVTIPKALADRYGIEPGDEIQFQAAGDSIRVTLEATSRSGVSPERRLESFEAATRRQRARERGRKTEGHTGRGWKREDLYDRARPR